MIAEENENIAKLCATIESHGTEIQSLSVELGIRVDDPVSEKEALVKIEYLLRTKLDELLEIKRVRMREAPF